jgi:uncharacterized damage-inducible protein DinB
MDQQALLSLYQFHAQANQVVLDTAAELSAEEFTREFSPSHGTIRMLLIHILGGDVYFSAVCRGQPPDMAELGALESLETVDAIRARFEQAAAETEAYIGTLDDAALAREVGITFGEHSFRLTVWQTLMQMIFHAQHHRGELSILLSELGHPLPTIDLMVHFITSSGQEWPFG